VGGFVLAFVKGWLLTLVMLVSIPLLAIAGAAMPIIVTRASSREQAAYAKASTVVEQTLGSIRTVRMLSFPFCKVDVNQVIVFFSSGCFFHGREASDEKLQRIYKFSLSSEC